MQQLGNGLIRCTLILVSVTEVSPYSSSQLQHDSYLGIQTIDLTMCPPDAAAPQVRINSCIYPKLKITLTSCWMSKLAVHLIVQFRLRHTPYSKMAAILVFFCLIAKWPCWPRSRLNFTFESEAKIASLQ